MGQSFAADEAINSAYITVSRWGRPGLEAGDWVMKGDATWENYALSGKWDPGPWNQYAPYLSGESFVVPSNYVMLPQTEGFLGTLKGWILRQYQYVPKQ
jgi:hypothetical protein